MDLDQMDSGLLIFDCDGVLVDSEVLVVEIEAELLTDAGFPHTAGEIIERYVGLSYPSMMADIARRSGRAVPDGLRAQVETAAFDRLSRDLRPVDGMAALLAEATRRARPRCVASSSRLDRITMSLEVAGLAGHFDPDHLFSTQMVERPKPAPDVFVLAAAQLGFEPERCVVIEDSPHGIEGARAAGMTPIGLVAGGHAPASLAERLSTAGAVEVFATTSELAAWLEL